MLKVTSSVPALYSQNEIVPISVKSFASLKNRAVSVKLSIFRRRF